jgi:GNAT superfamily N-acetyltransferase
MRIAPLRPQHRAPLSALLAATRAFGADEIQVALSLFDLSSGSDGPSGSAASAAVGPAASAAVNPAASAAVGPAASAAVNPAASAAVNLMDYEFVGAFGDADALLGYACFGPTPSTDGTYDLYWLAVDPGAQKQGVGRALVREVEQLLADRGARMLVAETSGRPGYARTREFYLAAGYVEAARVRDFYAPADDRIMLHRRITGRERGVATR